MSDNSKIEWTTHTFNPWWGCSRVSPGCVRCYADDQAKRYGHKVWRRHGPRRMLSDQNWARPLRWNRDAESAGEPAKVFCASMADVFEDHPDVAEPRRRLWGVIEATPWLRWQLLTKRPENVRAMVPWGDDWPAHVWLGTSVENQRYARERIPVLLKSGAKTLFLSCEPMLGPVMLGGEGWLPINKYDSWAGDGECAKCGTEEITRTEDGVPMDGHEVIHYCRDDLGCPPDKDCDKSGEETGEWCDGPIIPYPHIGWVIVGGESGPKSRPMDPNWARSLLEQCAGAGVPVFVKQLGSVLGRELSAGSKGGDWSAWPEDLRVREFPAAREAVTA